jgi:hypothetical protein
VNPAVQRNTFYEPIRVLLGVITRSGSESYRAASAAYFSVCFPPFMRRNSSQTQALKKTFQDTSKLPNKDPDTFADFILDELAFRAAVREGIEAADRGEVVSHEEVRKMIPKWASK